MIRADVRRWTAARPFQPFRVRCVNGRTFDVAHPELCQIGRQELILFAAGSAPPEMQHLSLIHIQSIVPLAALAFDASVQTAVPGAKGVSPE